MKNLSITLNLIMLILIGVLFDLYFSLKKSTGENVMPDTKGMSIVNEKHPVRIAHLNIDTLNVKYQCMVDTKKEMEARDNTIQTEFDSKSKVFQEEYMTFQQKSTKW